ncbi:MAG: hypothetical protein IAG13_09005 [Deltaproteobacteria bacterium]|nr:hypothetical protein [Nannocystaceae bacterium]
MLKRLSLRLLHALVPTAMVVAIVAPTLPSQGFGPTPGLVARGLLWISVKQNWGMYAPDPQRAQIYMDLEAEYADGSTALLREHDDVLQGWGTTWAWRKTRVDIWRFYANFHAEGRNDNRTWYLRSVCVREARTGEAPRKISMFHVKRRFASPAAVRAGKPGLGEPDRRLVTVQYCGTEPARSMIERDRELNPELYVQPGAAPHG